MANKFNIHYLAWEKDTYDHIVSWALENKCTIEYYKHIISVDGIDHLYTAYGPDYITIEDNETATLFKLKFSNGE